MEDQLYEEAVSSTEANVYKNLKNTTVRGSWLCAKKMKIQKEQSRRIEKYDGTPKVKFSEVRPN
jgi:predicted RNA-binding protein YlxR (DUF448 family)